MTNKNIKDIDKLFREGLYSEEDHFTDSGDGWLKMEQRLNRYDRRKRGIFWLTRMGSVAAMLLLFFVLRIIFTDTPRQVVQQEKVQNKEQLSTAQKGKEQTRQETFEEENKQSASSPEENYVADKTKEKPIIALTRDSESTVKPFQISSATPFPGQKSENMDSLKEEAYPVEEKTIAEPALTAKEENLPVAQPKKTPEDELSTAKEPIYATTEAPSVQHHPERSVHRMAFSVMAAPAYNGVNTLNNGSMGNDFGLLVSYDIARNWRFSTGGIYAKKLYETAFGNYHPKSNIWEEYYPESVNADCRVLDIPLNISYTFIKNKNRSISAGSGISSYIMLSENYYFTYAETDQENPLDYEIVNGSRHWLSVLNFQATIEQRINDRLSISLQPYLKLPLGTIGFAGVKLQSLGMAAHLNWNFTL